MLRLDQPNDKAISDFQAQRGSQAYLCRYPPCLHTFTGFSSGKLREEHEATHTPRYCCTHPTCGYPGWTFKTSAALRKHSAKYHDKEREFPVPENLSKRARHAPTERPLFQFRSDSSASRGTHAKTDVNATFNSTNDLDEPYLSNPDLLDNFDFEKFLQDTDAGDFNINPSEPRPYEEPLAPLVPPGWSIEWSDHYSKW